MVWPRMPQSSSASSVTYPWFLRLHFHSLLAADIFFLRCLIRPTLPIAAVEF